MAIVTGAIVCLSGILRYVSEEQEIIVKVSAVLLALVNVFYIFLSLMVYFVTSRHCKQIKCHQLSPQAVADFATGRRRL